MDGTPSAADPCFFADPRNLVRTTTQKTFRDTTATGTAYTYYVSALNRTHQKSAPSAGRAADKRCLNCSTESNPPHL